MQGRRLLLAQRVVVLSRSRDARLVSFRLSSLTTGYLIAFLVNMNGQLSASALVGLSFRKKDVCCMVNVGRTESSATLTLPEKWKKLGGICEILLQT